MKSKMKFVFCIFLLRDILSKVEQVNLQDLETKPNLKLIKDPYLRNEMTVKNSPRSLRLTTSIQEDQTNLDIKQGLDFGNLGHPPIEFDVPLTELQQQLKSYRKFTNSLIDAEMQSNAIKVYISNSVFMEKRKAERERMTLLTLNEKSSKKGVKLVKSNNNIGRRLTQVSQRELMEKEENILKKAEKGTLFKLDLNEIYQIDDADMKKFRKEFEANKGNV